VTSAEKIPSESTSRKQDVKAFLREMMIVGQDIRKPILAHGLHRNTVGQAILLIRAGFIERQGIKKGRARLWDDDPLWMVEHLPDSTDGGHPDMPTRRTTKGQKFGQDFIDSEKLRTIMGAAEGNDGRMPLIPMVGQRDQVKSISEEASHLA
jgi:hypothetical protein